MKSPIRSRLLLLSALCALPAACGSQAPQDATDTSGSALNASVTPMAAAVLPKLQGNWIELNGGLVTDPVITALPPIYYNVMATGPDGNIYSYFNNGIGNAWSGWVSLGNNGTPIKAPPAVVTYGNYIDVFAFDPTYGLISKHGTLNGPYAPTFTTTWLTQGGGLIQANNGKPPVVVLSQPNNQENIFAMLTNGSMGIMRTGLSLLGSYTSLSGVFNTATAPAAVSWGANRLDVFGLAGGNVYHRYSNDNGNTFYPANNSWESVGGTSGVSTPAVVSWGSGRLDLFELTSNGTAEHLIANGGNWENWCGTFPCWDQVGGNAWSDTLHGSATPVAVATGVGAVNLFFQGANHELFEAAMSTPDTATSAPKWTPEDGLAPCFRTGGSPSVISAHGTDIEIAVTAYDPSGDTNLWVNSTSGADVGTSNANNIPSCTCGTVGTSCCDHSACTASFSTCNIASEECIACGVNGQAACPTGTACQTAGYFKDSAGNCNLPPPPPPPPCSSNGAPSCNGSTCNSGLVLAQNGAGTKICVSSCGNLNEYPCVNGGCVDGDTDDALSMYHLNSSGLCEFNANCGTNGMPCCDASEFGGNCRPGSGLTCGFNPYSVNTCFYETSGGGGNSGGCVVETQAYYELCDGFPYTLTSVEYCQGSSPVAPGGGQGCTVYPGTPPQELKAAPELRSHD